MINRIKNISLIFLAALLVSGCVKVLPDIPPSPHLIRLSPEVPLAAHNPKAAKFQLLVEEPTADELLDSTRLRTYSQENGYNHEQAVAWIDRLPVLLQGSIIDHLDRSGNWIGVGRPGQGLRTDYVLHVHLHDFDLVQSVNQTDVLVKATAKLIKVGGRNVVGTFPFSKKIPLKDKALPTITETYNQATGTFLRALDSWIIKILNVN